MNLENSYNSFDFNNRSIESRILRMMSFPNLPDGQTLPEGYELVDPNPKEGGQARVYKCRRTKDQKLAAIKFFLPRILQSEKARLRIEREANAVWKLQKQSEEIKERIVELIEPPEFGESKFLVLKWMDGGSLADRQQAIDPLVAASLVSELAATVHLFGDITHRDIKPSNILFDDMDWSHPKISDFGLVKSPEDETITEAGTGTLGTPVYRAPEAASTATCKFDVYSLGKVLLFLLTGEDPPYANHDAWVTRLTPGMISSGMGNSAMGKVLCDTIIDCLETIPDNRPCPNELADALKSISQGKLPNSNSNSNAKRKQSFVRKLQEVSQLIEGEKNNCRLSAHEAPLLPFRHAELNAFFNFAIEQGVDSLQSLHEFRRLDDGRNLLHIAIETGYIELARFLIDELEFPLDIKDSSGRTSLHVASSLGRSEIVQLLLNDAAKPLLTNAKATVLYEAAFCDDDEEFEVIAESLRATLTHDEWTRMLTQNSKDGFTPLLVACWRGNFMAVDCLLSYDPALLWDVQTTNGEDAIVLATRAQSDAIVQRLIEELVKHPEREIRAKARGTTSIPPGIFFSNVRQGNTAFFEELFRNDWKPGLDNAASINMTERYDRCLIHEAAERGHYNIVEILCRHPDINVLARNNHGRRASDLAPKNHRDIETFLLKEEARARKRFRDSKTNTVKFVDRPVTKLRPEWLKLFKCYEDRSYMLFGYLSKLRRVGITTKQFEIYRENYFYRTDMTVRSIARLADLSCEPGRNDFGALGDISQNLGEEAGATERHQNHRRLLEISHNTQASVVFKLPELSINAAIDSKTILPQANEYRESRINAFYHGSYVSALAASFAQESTAGPMMEAFFHNLFLPFQFKHKDTWFNASRYFMAHLDSGVEENHGRMAFECLERHLEQNSNDAAEATASIAEFLNRQANLWDALHKAFVDAERVGRLIRVNS